MSQPFHTDPSTSPALAPKADVRSPAVSPAGRSHSFGLVAAVVTVALVLLWLVRQGHLPGPFRDMLPGGVSSNLLFVAQPDLNREQAGALYRQAVADLQGGEYESAIAKFKRLEAVYPGLTDMLWLRQAECYVGQGNEWAVQKKLNDLIAQYPQSPLKTLAMYRLGQSRFRGNEREKAQETFESIRQDAPQSTYATGSLYYLGVILAKRPETRSEGVDFLRRYLRLFPDGKFGGEAAEALEKFAPALSAEDHGLIGVAYAASSKNATRLMAHLRQGAPSLTWRALGKNQIRSGQAAQGVQTLLAGLPNAKSADETLDALDAALAATPATAGKIALLKNANARHLSFGGDYPLWKLAELDSANAATYYRELLQRFPEGDYAPESAWKLLWPLLSEGRTSEYLGQARQYLSRYAYARSAPKVLFWMAKLTEKGQSSEAIRMYRQLSDQYPNSYYAFRAQGRLKALAEGGADPGWRTEPEHSGYAPHPVDLNALDILPSPERFGSGLLGRDRRAEAEELQHMGLPEDTRIFVSESLNELPPVVASWIEQVSGDRAKGIRTLRTALELKARESFRLTGQVREASSSPSPERLLMPPAGTTDIAALSDAITPDAMKLLYPLYFSDFVASAAQRQKIDPFLVQALMREESYFNEFAVSSSNARGLMQLLPATAADVARWEGLPDFKAADLFLPETNIRLGTRYLAHLHALFHQNSMPAVGAYNGGPGAMGGWVRHSAVFASDPDMFVERIPYGQSRDYIKKVFSSYWNYRRLYAP